jgi:hypothetical protein
MVTDKEVEDLRYEYDKALRIKENLEANYERRKKLRLIDDKYESEIKEDIDRATEEMVEARKKYRAAESLMARSKIVEGGMDLKFKR